MVGKKLSILDENKTLISFLVLELASSIILTAICCMKVYHGEVNFDFVVSALLAVGAIAILALINKFAITTLYENEKKFLLFKKIMYFMNVLHLLQSSAVFVLVIVGKIR